MADVDDLIRHPRTFLRNNILFVTGPTGGTGGVMRALLRKATEYTGVNAVTGTRMDVFSLAIPGQMGDPLDVWWCPFEANNQLGTVLPGTGGPNVMFTYMMDGCTFATGSVTGNKSVSVHHINAAERGAALGHDAPFRIRAQRDIQRHAAINIVANPRWIDPDDYYEPTRFVPPVPNEAKISTVTFGRRSSQDGWKFYTHQHYTVRGHAFEKHFLGSKRVI